MGFSKDDKNINREGRPPGTRNKSSEEIRKVLLIFLERNLDSLQDLFEGLDANGKIRLLSVILRYTVSLPFNPEALTEDQLIQIINYLKNGQKQENIIARN